MDGRYFVSNSKDQCIKLWDLRKSYQDSQKVNCDTSKGTTDNKDHALNRTRANECENDRHTEDSQKKGEWYDCRRDPVKMYSKCGVGEKDSSVMTYRGHRVGETLARCYFSPAFTTGQQYIYTGSQTGNIHLYDVLTGQVVQQLRGHLGTVECYACSLYFLSTNSTLPRLPKTNLFHLCRYCT